MNFILLSNPEYRYAWFTGKYQIFDVPIKIKNTLLLSAGKTYTPDPDRPVYRRSLYDRKFFFFAMFTLYSRYFSLKEI